MIRSTLIALVLMAATGCAKKKAPHSPANITPAADPAPNGGDSDVRDESKPDDPDDEKKLGADPCDGGE